MIKKLKKLVVASLFAISALSIQASEETITDLAFEGLIHISPMVAQEIVGLQKGDVLDIKKIDEAIKKFYEQGYFQDIWVTSDGGDIVFHFKEHPIVANVDIIGYKEGEQKEELLKLLELKKGDVYRKAKAETTKRSLMETAEGEGYFDTVVEIQVEEINENSVSVTFDMNKGEHITIEDVHYCGAENLGQSDFESVTANKEREFLGWVWGRNDGKLNLPELQYDGPRIKDYYMRKGYLDATVSEPHLQSNFDTYTATMTYQIFEGERYTISDINITQSNEVVPYVALTETLRAEAGDIFNIEKLRKDVERMKQVIADEGYAFTQIVPDTEKNEADHTVAIRYFIDPGKKVRINDVIISGNTRTVDRAVRREILLAPGDLYSATDLKDSRNALKRTGYFDEVKIEEERIGEELMNLRVKVKEAMTGEFKFGVGYGSYGGFSASASTSNRNVLGSGMRASASLDFSNKNTEYRFKLYNPRVYDSIYSLSFDVFKTEYEAYDYTENKKGFSVTGGRYLMRHLRATLGYELSSTELSDFDEDNESRLAEYYDEGEFIKSSIIPGLKYDDTDDYLLPRSGMSITSYIDFAGIGGDEKYIKNYNKFALFYGLQDELDYDLILRLRASAGFIIDNGYLPINQKFYLGGIRTLRGYKSSSVSPRDSKDYRIGGKYMYANTVEASLPLMEGIKMRLALFYDFGMIGDDSIDEISRSSTGAAIEWQSPLGPINLIFPYALDDKEGDDTSSFEFTMGSQF